MNISEIIETNRLFTNNMEKKFVENGIHYEQSKRLSLFYIHCLYEKKSFYTIIDNDSYTFAEKICFFNFIRQEKETKEILDFLNIIKKQKNGEMTI